MSEDPFFASVILDSYLDIPLEYQIPSSFVPMIHPGSRVEISLRNQKKYGYVWEIKEKTKALNIKPLLGLLPEDLSLPSFLIDLAKFICSYYGANLWQVLRYLAPPKIRKEKKSQEKVLLSLVKSKTETARITALLREKFPMQATILDLLLKESPFFLSELVKRVRCSISPIETLINKKLIQKEKKEFIAHLKEYLPTEDKDLSSEQKAALEAIAASLEKNSFQTYLLFGVTGSGKTEVYLQSTKKALKQGKSVLIMVPEVALTSQLIEKFQARMQQEIAVWHHKKSDSERYRAWQNVKSGKTKIIIGARSALFCPAKLGLIIVDEEHDASYKQSEEMPCYSARDLAIYRGKKENACVILGSATPSLESYYQVKREKYTLLRLTARAQKAAFPKVEIIDQKMEFEKSKGFIHFSSPLLSAIKKRVRVGEQTLLFLNRRGYHKSQLCTSCGKVVECPRCSISMTYHKKEFFLLCHLCGHTAKVARHCPYCKEESSLQFKGFGTEHVEASLKAIFPEIRTLRMDRDTTRRKDSHEELFFSFRSGKADVLIGTQMISKGFDFPNVTLVGILQSDVQLTIPDFRAEEFLFQQIVQVAGRSGRAELPGEVIIQTFRPHHQIIQYAAAADYEAFYEKQIEDRKLFDYPPFSRMIKLIFSSTEEELAKKESLAFYNRLLPIQGKIYPPIPCGHAKIKDNFRYQCLLLTKKILPIVQKIKRLPKPSKGVSLFIDVDPLSTF